MARTTGSRLSADAREWGIKVYAFYEVAPYGPYRAVCPCGWADKWSAGLARAQARGENHFLLEHDAEVYV